MPDKIVIRKKSSVAKDSTGLQTAKEEKAKAYKAVYEMAKERHKKDSIGLEIAKEEKAKMDKIIRSHIK